MPWQCYALTFKTCSDCKHDRARRKCSYFDLTTWLIILLRNLKSYYRDISCCIRFVYRDAHHYAHIILELSEDNVHILLSQGLKCYPSIVIYLNSIDITTYRVYYDSLTLLLVYKASCVEDFLLRILKEILIRVILVIRYHFNR